jgi:RNA polymerase sigma-70 factor (ECF subfamily)
LAQAGTTSGVLSIGLAGEGEGVSQRRVDRSREQIIQMYDSLRPALYRYLVNGGTAPQDVEEFIQEAFLRLYRHLQDGGDDQNLRAWIYQVVHNLSCNFRKSRRRLVDATPEMWENLSQSTSDELSRLTPLQRDCLNLRLEGFRYREIGAILNVSTSTVAGSLRNALARIVKGSA